MVFLRAYAEGTLISPHRPECFPSLLEILQGEHRTDVGAAITEFRLAILSLKPKQRPGSFRSRASYLRSHEGRAAMA